MTLKCWSAGSTKGTDMTTDWEADGEVEFGGLVTNWRRREAGHEYVENGEYDC